MEILLPISSRLAFESASPLQALKDEVEKRPCFTSGSTPAIVGFPGREDEVVVGYSSLQLNRGRRAIEFSIELPRSSSCRRRRSRTWLCCTDLIEEAFTGDGRILKLDVPIVGDEIGRGAIGGRHPVTCVEDVEVRCIGFHGQGARP